MQEDHKFEVRLGYIVSPVRKEGRKKGREGWREERREKKIHQNSTTTHSCIIFH
jgi:hypothetical protein